MVDLDKESPRREGKLMRTVHFFAGALFGALAAVAAMYVVLLVKLLLDSASSECSGEECARGTGGSDGSDGSDEPDGPVKPGSEPGRLGHRLRIALALAVALAALWPGWQAYERMRGPQMYVASSQPADRPSSARGIGAWPTPTGGMARARTDGTVLFDGEGREEGAVAAPVRSSVCALSRTTPCDVGIVAYGESREQCGASIAAIDLATGRRLWWKEALWTGLATRAPLPVAAAQGTAVALTEGA